MDYSGGQRLGAPTCVPSWICHGEGWEKWDLFCLRRIVFIKDPTSSAQIALAETAFLIHTRYFIDEKGGVHCRRY